MPNHLQAAWKPKHNPWLIALTVTIATFMEVLDTSIANVALPHIAGSVGASQEEATWVLTSYLVASAVILPISGWLSDRFGRKRIYLIGSVATGIFGFICFAMLNTMVPAWIFLGIILSFVPHDLMYGPQAALIAECFTPRLRCSGCSIGYQLASVIAGGPAPLIATALLAAFGSGYVIAVYILFCAIVSIVATALMPDLTNRDISQEHA